MVPEVVGLGLSEEDGAMRDNGLEGGKKDRADADDEWDWSADQAMDFNTLFGADAGLERLGEREDMVF